MNSTAYTYIHFATQTTSYECFHYQLSEIAVPVAPTNSCCESALKILLEASQIFFRGFLIFFWFWCDDDDGVTPSRNASMSMNIVFTCCSCPSSSSSCSWCRCCCWWGCWGISRDRAWTMELSRMKDAGG